MKKWKRGDDAFDETDYPIPYTNKQLLDRWFDFDDSNVVPIQGGRLQTQFGGGRENAYILIYTLREA